MDLSSLETIIPLIARRLGIEASTLVFYLGATSVIAHIIGKRIPDSAVGWRAVVRDVCKVLGVVISNRLTPTVTTVDVAKQLLGQSDDPTKRNEILESATDATALVPQVVDEIADEAPRIIRDPIGQYARKRLDPGKDER